VELPLSVRRSAAVFTFRSRFPRSDALVAQGERAEIQLRIQVTCENAAWQTMLAVPSQNGRAR
jgi:hypothetical protein